MASTVTARRLTEAHRLAQGRIGAQTILAMRAIWGLLDPDDLDGSFDRWLGAALPIVRGQRSMSARLAANYLTAFKTLEIGGTAPVVLAEAAPAEAVITSLLVTGPIHIKKAMSRGVSLVRALDMAEATSAAAAMRHAVNGGRETIVDSVRADRQALGYARTTSGSACAFCAMLAGRGAVYSKDTAGFESHDHCSCGVEPVYRESQRLPAGSERYAGLWREAKSLDGDTATNFRRLLEAA